MTGSAADLIVRGTIVVAAEPAGLELAEAIAIREGLVVAVGRRDDISVPAGARLLDAGSAAVVPGLHDFHLHLVGLARARRSILLDDAVDPRQIADLLTAAAADTAPHAWITGRGWSEASLRGGTALLEAAVAGRAAFLSSHDGHSAWVSAEARRRARLDRNTPDPAGGRVERDGHGEPTGVLRERALDLVASSVTRLQGAGLRQPLDEVLRELAAVGITGACEAGDYTDENGIGADAALGDSYSSLTDMGDLVDGRLRLALGIPADAIAAAASRGLRTGASVAGRRTLRFGWAKHYTDGTLGSGTAARFSPEGEIGIMRVGAERLDADFADARTAGIGVALHAIGDRAVAEALDAIERAGPRSAGQPPDRIEHVQLLRASDAERFASLDVTASIQPVHAAADRDLVEAQWAGREDDAYAWRSLADAGARLAAGSDAPVESVNPWLGMFAAVHRRHPDDRRGDWRVAQALTFVEALAAYTSAPARSRGIDAEGHLRVGATADLAVLSADLETLRAADERLGQVRSDVTLVDGQEVHRS